jgi:cytochrome c-type biogenesis protein CcmH/NrfG
MGADEMAWDYLTTPLAESANESTPWTNLAATLRQQGDFLLADRAYATAYEIEPTNAQILWDRAQLLQQSQRHAEAVKLYKQIADGTWQPRFSGIQQQAKRYVQAN